MANSERARGGVLLEAVGLATIRQGANVADETTASNDHAQPDTKRLDEQHQPVGCLLKGL